MQFTPQQISGGARYGTKVKIGNWNEERSRIEVGVCGCVCVRVECVRVYVCMSTPMKAGKCVFVCVFVCVFME